MHFLTPVALADWKSYDVAGIVGILRKTNSGQYELIDAFDCTAIPGAHELAVHEKFYLWAQAAGSPESVCFDVFLMPRSDWARRSVVVTLLERSCGFRLPTAPAYVNVA